MNAIKTNRFVVVLGLSNASISSERSLLKIVFFFESVAKGCVGSKKNDIK